MDCFKSVKIQKGMPADGPVLQSAIQRNQGNSTPRNSIGYGYKSNASGLVNENPNPVD